MTWNDEDASRTLGTRLKLMEAPAHRVRVDEVVRAGRRSERRRRLATGAAVLALVVAVAVAVPVAVRDSKDAVDTAAVVEVNVGPIGDADCAIHELPRPAGTDFAIERVDPSGRIKLGITSAGATVLVWNDGEPSMLTLPGITSPGLLSAVNSGGVIVGSMAGRPWMYRGDRTVEWLALPPGYTSGSPMAINDGGDVTGNVAALTEGPGRYSRAAVWPADARDRPVVLEPDQDSVATAIAPDRTVAGALLNYAGHPWVATVWTPDGDRRVLNLPFGWSHSQATAIAGDFVYGTISPVRTAVSAEAAVAVGPVVPDVDVPARWSLRTGQVQFLSTLPGTLATVGTGGWIVVTTGPRFARTGVVVVSPALRAVRLPMPSWADGVGNHSVIVRWISRDGRTIAGNVPMASGHRPVVWQCR